MPNCQTSKTFSPAYGPGSHRGPVLIVEVSKEAVQELEESAAWYEKEDLGLGARLVDAFAHAVRLLEEPNPR